MRFRHLLAIPLLCAALWGQDAALKDTFLQAKALWATQGDREGATTHFDTVVATLAPKAAGLDAEWLQLLCEAYNWLAVLDDRSAQNRPRAQVRLQALIDLNPDFDLDRALTSQRLAALFDRMKGEKYALVKLTYAPEGGRLLVDGRAGAPLSRKYLVFGTHKLTYARPGHATAEIALDLGPRDVKSADFKLARIASTITLYVQPSDVEVLLDGQSLGFAIGKAGADAASLTLPLGLRPEDLSAAFIIPELAAGKHRLELRAPCFRTQRLELGADLATPAADHTLELIRMEPSRGVLSVRSIWPGGELFLSGQSRGPLPAVDLPVCSGPYDLLVRFPAGGFSQRITVEDGKALNLEARPKPRLAFLGLEAGEFTGRARFLAQLETLGDRLEQLAFLPARPDEPPTEALARLKASRETELVLIARPVQDKVIHRVELVLATLDGEEERLLVKPLELAPLDALVARLNEVPRLHQPGLGVSVLDLPGEPGPWVLAASESAMKAGLQTGKPLLQVQGKPISTVEGLRQLTETAKEPVAVSQDGATAVLPVQVEALEVSLGAPALSYPAVLAHLRLQYAGAKGDDANLIKLNLALVLMQFRKYDKAIELLRDARLSTTRGVSQGTIDYHTGRCFLHLGTSYQSEAGQAFRQALKYPQATLLGPDGPLVAPLARQALEDLK
jgi:tetratricopeptide (TPR) repeat protein